MSHEDDETDGSADDGDDAGDGELKRLAHRLERLEQLENELSLAQRWVQGRLGEVWDAIDDAVDDGTEDGHLYAGLIGAIANGKRDVSAISRAVDAPPQFVEEGLEWLAERGVVEEVDGEWRLCD